MKALFLILVCCVAAATATVSYSAAYTYIGSTSCTGTAKMITVFSSTTGCLMNYTVTNQCFNVSTNSVKTNCVSIYPLLTGATVVSIDAPDYATGTGTGSAAFGDNIKIGRAHV